MVTYSYTAPGSIKKVTVGTPGSLQAGRYDIVAYGGGGGTGVATATTGGNSGGKGAEAGGYFILTAGEKLEIIAAGSGGNGLVSSGGGGGASQVFAYINGRYVPLVVAGGGGGGGFLVGRNGGNATVGAPGSGGGGSYVSATGNGFSGAGGAGATSGGGSGLIAKGGADAAAGGAGGIGSSNGGFGGGGGSASAGGGGGGFSGGNGGTAYSGGGGGTSFVSPTYGTADAAHIKAGVVTGAGQVLFDPAPICFATGTLIRTARGDVAVEGLCVGDLAITASGRARPIRWLGHRALDLRSRPRPNEGQPIRIAAHAFAHGQPARDLYLSPGHPVLVGADEDGEGGYLVPIMCLINGTTIERVEVESVTYWHVELDAHDILLAEGLPAESYLDWGDRAFFTEGSDHALQNPDFVVPGLTGRCRPVALDGPIVEAARRRLDAVLSHRLHAACSWPSHAVSAW